MVSTANRSLSALQGTIAHESVIRFTGRTRRELEEELRRDPTQPDTAVSRAFVRSSGRNATPSLRLVVFQDHRPTHA